MRTHGVATRTAGALVATVGVGLAGWAIAVPRMSGMDMGVASTLGSFPFFVTVWVPMMAAMMLPGVAPSALRVAAAPGRQVIDIPSYVLSYLAVWALVGVGVFALYRPHGRTIAGLAVIAAGLYELTPLKHRFRRMCREELDQAASGWVLGRYCVGSSIGLMVVMIALGAMSLMWMALVGVVVLMQKLMPPRAVIDVPVVVAIVGIGLAELAR